MPRPRCIQPFEVILLMSMISGVFPSRNPSIFYLFRCGFTIFVNFAFISMLIAEMVHSIYDVERINEIMCLLVPISSYFSKLVAFTWNKESVNSIIDTIESDEFNIRPEYLDEPLHKAINIVGKITNMLIAFSLITVAFYTLAPVFDNTALPVPFSYDFGRYRMFIYVFQIFGIFQSGFNCCIVDLMYADCMAIGAAQIDILKGRIEGMLSEALDSTAVKYSSGVGLRKDVDVKVKAILRYCIVHHMIIVRFVKHVERIYSGPLLVQYMTAVIVVCNVASQLLLNKESNSQLFIFGLSGAIITELTLYHWFGNEVIIKSSQLGEACYNSQWYDCSIGVRKSLLIIMERAKRPLVITVYKFTIVSLESYVTIFRWSYSIFAVIKNAFNN